jgi:hypothetical protein
VLVFAVATSSDVPANASATALVANVHGNKLENGSGQQIQLRGVNEAGLESYCEQGYGFFDPTTLDNSAAKQASVAAAIRSWGANAVRLTLNEGCWLGEYPFTSADPCKSSFANAGACNNPAPYEGAAYRSEVENYVHLLNNKGLYVIVTLAIPAPKSSSGTLLAGNMNPIGMPMPDAGSVTFWRQVATAFKPDHGVLFDLYGEPIPKPYTDSTSAWSCWLNGCSETYLNANTGAGGTYQAVGMKELVATVRATGATQPIVLGGVDYAGTMSLSGSNNGEGWLTWAAKIPNAGALVASLHTYACDSDVSEGACDNGTSTYESWCVTQSCLADQLAGAASAASKSVTSKYPVVIGEFGDYNCDGNWPTTLMNFADNHWISYLAWSWNGSPWDTCSTGPDLLTSDAEVTTGTSPTAYGLVIRTHLLSRASIP